MVTPTSTSGASSEILLGTTVALVIVEPTNATGLPSQQDVDAQAQVEMAHMLSRLEAAKAQAQEVRRELGPNNTSIWHVRAGARDEVEELGAEILDFSPKNLTVRAGDTVVWGSTFFHSVTFVPAPPVPDLFNVRLEPAGPPTLLLNPQAFAPAKPAAVYDPAQHFNSGLIGLRRRRVHLGTQLRETRYLRVRLRLPPRIRHEGDCHRAAAVKRLEVGLGLRSSRPWRGSLPGSSPCRPRTGAPCPGCASCSWAGTGTRGGGSLSR